jgi:hypothetical protein
METKTILLLFSIFALSVAIDLNTYPWMDMTLDPSDRAKKLIANMTL